MGGPTKVEKVGKKKRESSRRGNRRRVKEGRIFCKGGLPLISVGCSGSVGTLFLHLRNGKECLHEGWVFRGVVTKTLGQVESHLR